MANTNTFIENLNKLTKEASDVLSYAEAMNEAMTGNSDTVTSPDGLTLPSYPNVLNRLKRVEKTVSTFTSGKGTVETDDGTYRKIKVDTVSKPAATISGIESDGKFSIDANWFFESLQFPRCKVKIDLTDKIDANSDRVYVNRIIVDSTQSKLSDTLRRTLIETTSSYGDLINYLNYNNIEYREDKDEIKLPLTYEKYKGKFQITGTSLVKNESGISEPVYYISTIEYNEVDENGAELPGSKTLSKGDYLRYNNSLLRVKEINQPEKWIKIDYTIGYETIGIYDTLEFYNDPFSEKIISVGIGINEIDIIYVKGVNENYNLLSNEWSNPVSFYTNTLTFEENPDVDFLSYYNDVVSDFGSVWISMTKEGQKSAYYGIKPNAPVLNDGDFRVVQINTQLEATLDSERYNQITSEIASTKSNISAIRTTISSNKDKVMKETDSGARETIQNAINSDTEKWNNLTTQFSSLVEELNTLLTDSGTINYSPKYHIRGFFNIPEPVYAVNDGIKKVGKQEIIGFEVMYRYLHVDETGSALNTFSYNDSTTGIVQTGTFTDWNVMKSSILEKVYNEDTDSYVWKHETADGSQIVINQIDIPIRNGEKVEFKIRSISEAGYPYSPLKSDWSNSVIVSFPDNLSSSDSVTTILETVKSDMTSVILQETLSAAGIYTHIADSNSKYKHNSNNIEYDESYTDSSGNTFVNTISLYDKIKTLTQNIQKIASSLGLTLGNSGSIDGSINFIKREPAIRYKYFDSSANQIVEGELTISTTSDDEETNKAIDTKLLDLSNTIVEKMKDVKPIQ